MARLSRDHEAHTCGMTGKCSVPMFMGGSPAGFCDRPAYGQQRDPWYRGERLSFAPGLACHVHDGPNADSTRLMRDGNAWCAFGPDFENLQESVAGFGATQAAALADYAKARTLLENTNVE